MLLQVRTVYEHRRIRTVAPVGQEREARMFSEEAPHSYARRSTIHCCTYFVLYFAVGYNLIRLRLKHHLFGPELRFVVRDRVSGSGMHRLTTTRSCVDFRAHRLYRYRAARRFIEEHHQKSLADFMSTRRGSCMHPNTMAQWTVKQRDRMFSDFNFLGAYLWWVTHLFVPGRDMPFSRPLFTIARL